MLYNLISTRLTLLVIKNILKCGDCHCLDRVKSAEQYEDSRQSKNSSPTHCQLQNARLS